MSPKVKKLTDAQIETMINAESDKDDDDLDEIFGPGVELEDEDLDQVFPSRASNAAAEEILGGEFFTSMWKKSCHFIFHYQSFVRKVKAKVPIPTVLVTFILTCMYL